MLPLHHWGPPNRCAPAEKNGRKAKAAHFCAALVIHEVYQIALATFRQVKVYRVPAMRQTVARAKRRARVNRRKLELHHALAGAVHLTADPSNRRLIDKFKLRNSI